MLIYAILGKPKSSHPRTDADVRPTGRYRLEVRDEAKNNHGSYNVYERQLLE